jgi:hypothetical protein
VDKNIVTNKAQIMTFWQPPFTPKAFFPDNGRRAINGLKEKFKNYNGDVLTEQSNKLIMGLAGNPP